MEDIEDEEVMKLDDEEVAKWRKRGKKFKRKSDFHGASRKTSVQKEI